MKKSLSILAIFSVFALSACSGNDGPSDSQAKQALAEFYSFGSPEAEKAIKERLDKETKLKSCVVSGEGYLCDIENVGQEFPSKAYFAKDPQSGKWIFDVPTSMVE